MTWHAVHAILPSQTGDLGLYVKSRDRMNECIVWCQLNLSSKGVLWDHNRYDNWRIFYFAQPQDAIMFRLVMGV